MQQTPAGRTSDDWDLIDIGGRRLALYGSGAGEPAVVLEAGLTDPADIWRDVRDEIAAFTRVYSYDRAGRGASDQALKPRVVGDAVADLRALLERAAVPEPCVFVGHSFGGLIVQQYAHSYPDQVAGLVLVDSSHPQQTEKILAALPQRMDEAATFFRATYMESYEDPEMNVEGFDLATSMRHMGSIRSLGAMPVAVLTAESVFGRAELPPDQIDRLQAVWFLLQKEFSGLSTHVSSRVVKGSEHYIFHSHPQDVVGATRWVVEQVRLPTTEIRRA